ncbi:hypothetical protein FB451DRAFT_1295066 [Mycena latifolia]|nr:hypothetical protein FB451DRAFT_1295066 [Mycena latifolia]
MVHTIHPATSVSYRCDHAYCTSCGTYCASVSSSWCSPCTQCIGWLGAGAAGTEVGFNLDKVADGGFSGFDKPCREGPTSGAVGCTFCAVIGGFAAIAPARLPPPPHVRSFAVVIFRIRLDCEMDLPLAGGQWFVIVGAVKHGTGFGHGARQFERRWWCCCTSAGSGWAPAFLLLHLRTHLRRLRRLLHLLWGSHILRHRSASEAVIMGRTIEEPDSHPQQLYKGSCSLVHHFGGRGQAGDCQ